MRLIEGSEIFGDDACTLNVNFCGHRLNAREATSLIGCCPPVDTDDKQWSRMWVVRCGFVNLNKTVCMLIVENKTLNEFVVALHVRPRPRPRSRPSAIHAAEAVASKRARRRATKPPGWLNVHYLEGFRDKEAANRYVLYYYKMTEIAGWHNKHFVCDEFTASMFVTALSSDNPEQELKKQLASFI